MRLFIKKVFFYFITYGLIISIIPAYILLFTPKLSAIDYDGGLVIKRERLKKLKDTQKIVFIGGSNLPMGTNSKTIEDSLHIKVVNFGHRFQFKLGYYLRETKDYLKAGDIVVIEPEYQIMLEDHFSDNELNPVFWEGLHEKTIPINDILQMLPNTYEYMMVRYRRRSVKAMPENLLNRKSGFNEYGDLTCHWFWKGKHFDNFVQPDNIKFDKRLQHDLEEYKEYCDSKKIKLVLIPPMYSKGSFENAKHLVDTTVVFWKQFGLEYTRNPADYVLADSFFYDSPYHLRYLGVSRKTEMVIEDLRKIVKGSRE